MWTVVKYDKKKLNIFIKDLKKKLNDDVLVYSPKIKIQKYKKRKLISEELDILGDYIFCFNSKFENQKIVNELKFTKGLKYFLNGFYKSQDEIVNFIKKCKKFENKQGFLSSDFFDIECNKKYKFNSGPLLNLIFQMIEIQKNKFKILMGNKVTTIKKDILFAPF